MMEIEVNVMRTHLTIILSSFAAGFYFKTLPIIFVWSIALIAVILTLVFFIFFLMSPMIVAVVLIHGIWAACGFIKRLIFQ